MFKVKHLFLSGMWFDVVARTKTIKEIMCQTKIGLCAQNMITIIGSNIANIIGGGWVYDDSMSMRIFTLIMNKIIV